MTRRIGLTLFWFAVLFHFVETILRVVGTAFLGRRPAAMGATSFLPRLLFVPTIGVWLLHHILPFATVQDDFFLKDGCYTGLEFLLVNGAIGVFFPPLLLVYLGLHLFTPLSAFAVLKPIPNIFRRFHVYLLILMAWGQYNQINRNDVVQCHSGWHCLIYSISFCIVINCIEIHAQNKRAKSLESDHSHRHQSVNRTASQSPD